MEPKLKEIRRKLYDEFDFYSKSALKIRTKDGDIQPLKLKPAQVMLQEAVDKQMATEGKVRIIILKARQQGLSTYVGGYLYFNVSQRKACKAMVSLDFIAAFISSIICFCKLIFYCFNSSKIQFYCYFFDFLRYKICLL